jgi:pimeloyl-ACP methyl ester carboxylesterase
MRIPIAAALTAATLCLGSALPAWAQTVAGTWQGVIAAPGLSVKEVIKITQGPDGKLRGEAFHPGPEGAGMRNGNSISTVEVRGGHVHLVLDDYLAPVDADLSADGNSLVGTTIRAGQTLPVKFDRATDKTAWPLDPSPHKVRFVEVEKGVRLEVLDWGGKGPPLVFVPGGGDSAHVYDDFAPLFTARHHVYAITRRGSGMSSKPEPTVENYGADRLGEDVFKVIDALKLDRPVLAGHSRGGGELSFFGMRHPERVSGLIYLEAGYNYALYDPKTESKVADIASKRRGMAPPPGALILGQSQSPQSPQDKITAAIFRGSQKYTAINGPVLAIFANAAAGDAVKDAYMDGFETGAPQAKVVRLANGDHYVFQSNPAEVEREMNAFMDGLVQAPR